MTRPDSDREVPDCLRRLTPEELAKAPPITKEQICDALEQGLRDRDALESATPPDSGEREVTCPICERPLCRTTLGDSADHEQRARCYRRGFARLQDELAWRADEVRVPLTLAQRILAALTGSEPLASWRERDALASELRASTVPGPEAGSGFARGPGC